VALEFVRKLHRRLTRDGVRCFFDESDIAVGANFVLAQEKAMAASRHVILVLSPDFVDSEWTAIERTAAMVDDPAGLGRRLMPILRRDCPIPPFLAAIQRLDCRTDEEFEAAYPRLCRALGGVPGEDVSPPVLRRGEIPPVPERYPDRFDVPHRSLADSFVGRAGEIWALHDALAGRRAAVVVGRPPDAARPAGGTVASVQGMAGVGESQLAIEYAHRFAPYYTGGVYWIQAERTARLDAARRIASAARIVLPAGAGEDEEMRVLWTELRRFPPSLIVLDNFPEKDPSDPAKPADLSVWLPPGGPIHLLVTTRRRGPSPFAAVIDVDVLPEEDADRLLVQTPPVGAQEKKAAREIVKRLGGLPIAVEIAASFFRARPEARYRDYLAALDNRGALEAIRETARRFVPYLPSGHGIDVVAAFAECWDACTADARRCLAAMAFLAPEPVPLDLLRDVLADVGGFAGGGALDDPLAGGLDDLGRRSLVKKAAAGRPIAHRLILEFALSRTPEAEREKYLRACEKAVMKRMDRPLDVSDTASLRDLISILAHAEALAEAVGREKRWAVLDDLATRIARHQQDRGLAVAAEWWARRSLSAAQELEKQGEGPETARSLSNLALVMQDLGKPEEARPLLERALKIGETTYGPDHPAVATSLSNLAMVMQDLGKPEEARPLLERALRILERSYGASHPRARTV
jgi:tetratricopeptide (TPR) repeat protein